MWLSGRASSMNAVAVFIGVLFFGWLWSGWGPLLGAPRLAVLKTVADRVEGMHGVSELLGWYTPLLHRTGCAFTGGDVLRQCRIFQSWCSLSAHPGRRHDSN
jgi:hypothetical protein